MKKKTYRFFYHYNKQAKKMTVHFQKQCFLVDKISCQVPCETKQNKRQPRIVMQGFCGEVRIENDLAEILG